MQGKLGELTKHLRLGLPPGLETGSLILGGAKTRALGNTVMSEGQIETPIGVEPTGTFGDKDIREMAEQGLRVEPAAFGQAVFRITGVEV